MVANYYKPGPATRADVKSRIANPSSRGAGDHGSWHVADNHVEDAPEVTADNWLGVQGSSFKKLAAPWEAMPIRQQSAKDAYLAVLARVGCSLPRRDSIDARIVEEVRNGKAAHGKNGIIDSPKDVSGWPELKTGTASTDTDNDGMPDEWEKKYGFDAGNADDSSADKDGDGYTNVEEYLNGTNPTEFVDYTKPENNTNTLEKANEK